MSVFYYMFKSWCLLKALVRVAQTALGVWKISRFGTDFQVTNSTYTLLVWHPCLSLLESEQKKFHSSTLTRMRELLQSKFLLEYRYMHVIYASCCIACKLHNKFLLFHYMYSWHLIYLCEKNNILTSQNIRYT